MARAQAQQVPPLIEEDPVLDFGAADCIAEVAGAEADCARVIALLKRTCLVQYQTIVGWSSSPLISDLLAFILRKLTAQLVQEVQSVGFFEQNTGGHFRLLKCNPVLQN